MPPNRAATGPGGRGYVRLVAFPRLDLQQQVLQPDCNCIAPNVAATMAHRFFGRAIACVPLELQLQVFQLDCDCMTPNTTATRACRFFVGQLHVHH